MKLYLSVDMEGITGLVDHTNVLRQKKIMKEAAK